MLNKKALSAAFGVEKDADFKQTVLLLHGDGTNGAQNNTFTDSSTNAFTITRNGNTTQGTFSPFSVADGEWSNYFDGTGDYLAFANGTFYLSNNNFVVEAFVYLPNAISGSNGTIAAGNTDAATAAGSSWDMTINTSQKLASTVWIGSTNYTITSSASVSTGQWVHLAFVRTGGTISQFINGTKDGTNTTLSTNSVQNGSNTYPPHVGRNGGGADFPGYISNFRLIVGSNASSVYDATGSSITAPTAPLTAVTDTKVLTCRSNRFVDISSSPNTVTPNGNTSVQPFSPFAPSAAYSASTNGGSGYFDGSGDYLSVPDNAVFDYGSGNFTLECWIYPTISNDAVLITAQTSGALYGPCNLYFSSGQLQLYSSSNNSSFDVASGAVIGTPQVNAWSHIAVSRDGNSIRCFLNGVLGSTTTSSATLMNATETFQIAAREGSQFYTGYISGFRVVKGTAVYTGAFTPPTAPLTAITNTSLLCNFTNAAIFDQTGKNNLETVGNAQIDTGTKKFGTGSLEFDGSGDALALPANINLAVGSGNFTIEMWVNAADNGSTVGGSYPRLFTFGTAQGAGCIECYNLSGTMYVDISATGGPISFTASTLLNSTWNHYAISRDGTSLKAFVNGTQVGTTGTNSTNINLAATTQSWIGAISASAGNFNGYIDDLRITKGIARYTANFTAPTKAFPDQ